MKHTSVRLFTFDNHPPQHLWNYYQIWVGGLVRGKGHYVIKPESQEEEETLRREFALCGYSKPQIDDIINYIYKKLFAGWSSGSLPGLRPGGRVFNSPSRN